MDLSGLFNKQSNMNVGHGALQDALANYSNTAEALYKPWTLGANAASKLTYQQLMGPQFVAKMLGNKDVTANMKQPGQVADATLQAGLSTGYGGQQSSAPPRSNTGNPIQDWIHNNIMSKMFGEEQKPGQAEQSPQQQQQSLQQQPNPVASPAEVRDIAEKPIQLEGRPGQQMQMVPGTGEAEGLQTVQASPPIGEQAPTAAAPEAAPANGQEPWNENIAKAEGSREQGKEQGKFNAKAIDDLSTVAYNADTNLSNLKPLAQIVASPEFENMRQVPLAGHLELAYFGKYGTPAQQQMVGAYTTATNNIIKDSSRDFAGQFRAGEQELLQNMKLSDKDTVDMAKGKLATLMSMQQLLRDRAAKTAELMSQPNTHYTKLQASKLADKEINGDKIRRDIHDKLNPTITIHNKKTGEEITVSPQEARAKYGVEHYAGY